MDEADHASEQVNEQLRKTLERHKGEIEPGQAGECDLCGEYTGRLVRGACAPCRDRHGLD